MLRRAGVTRATALLLLCLSSALHQARMQAQESKINTSLGVGVSAPVNPKAGQRLILAVFANGAPRTITLGTGWRFGSDSWMSTTPPHAASAASAIA